MPALAARRLTKSYGSRRAVDEANLAIAPGEVLGLLGPNGAGKTTVLRMVLGLVRPDAGEIEIFGYTPRWSSDAPPPRVAGLVEEPTFYPYLSGRANLELLTTLEGGTSCCDVNEVLDRVALGAHANERVAGYSTGMRQRLGLASALLRAPRLLLLDEPTAGLDPDGMRFVQRFVGELAERGVAVLLSSHHIVEVETICDTFTVLRGGRVVWNGTLTAMLDQAPTPSVLLRTSDDERAAKMAREWNGLTCRTLESGGLEMTAGESVLDAFVLALARSDIAVRRLEQSVSALEAMFFALTQ